MLIYDIQFLNETDLNENYKILSYFHKSVTKLISDIFGDQGEGVFTVKHPNM